MRRMKRCLALATALAVFASGKPLVAQEVEYYSFCVHLGDQYYGNQGWRVIYCANVDTGAEIYIWEAL